MAMIDFEREPDELTLFEASKKVKLPISTLSDAIHARRLASRPVFTPSKNRLIHLVRLADAEAFAEAYQGVFETTGWKLSGSSGGFRKPTEEERRTAEARRRLELLKEERWLRSCVTEAWD
jgi:hypothetical protein